MREKFIAAVLTHSGTDVTDMRLVVGAPQEAQNVFGIQNGYPTLRRVDLTINYCRSSSDPFDRFGLLHHLPAPGELHDV